VPYELTRQLDSAVAEVFAIMLTLTCVPSEDGRAPGEPCFTATVDFSGALVGSCSLRVEEATAVALTSSFVGLPAEELPRSLFLDTVGELCNMIAGGWKSRQPPPRSSCTLSPPVVSSHCERVWDGSLTRLYCFEAHHLILKLKLS
jgi:chemotaxis protein CheX